MTKRGKKKKKKKAGRLEEYYSNLKMLKEASYVS